MPGPSLYDAQQIGSNAGLRTQYGIILPPGARVAAYVRSTGVQSGDDGFLGTNLVTTLAAGLARVRSGFGDFVVCLPGHVESVTDGTTFSGALVAGAKIIGVGRGSNTPTFNFTASGSQWLVNKADVLIAGLRLNFGAAINPTLVLTVNAPDFGLYFNDIVVGVAGVGGAQTVLTLQAGADRADISNNVFRGIFNVVGTDGIVVSGAIDSLRICDNEMIFATNTTNGLIRFAAAATNFKILRNVMVNSTAASVACIVFGAVAATGQCAYNSIQVQSTGAITQGTTGITTGATMTGGFYQNFVSNDPRVSGILSPAADT